MKRPRSPDALLRLRLLAIAVALLSVHCSEAETRNPVGIISGGVGGGGDPFCEDERPDPDGVISRSCHSLIESETHLAVAPDGRIAVAWIGIDTSGTHIGVTLSNGEGAWSPIQVVLAEENRVASDPALVADREGRFHLTFIGFRRDSGGGPIDMRLYVASTEPQGTTFGAPTDITFPEDASVVDKPWIALTEAGTLIIPYAYAKPGAAGLAVARRPQGGSFSHSIVVEQNASEAFRNLAYPCASGGHLWIASFELLAGPKYQIGVRRSDDEGLTFPAANAVTASTDDDDFPAFGGVSCAAAGESLWVAYGLSDVEPDGEEGLASLPWLKAIRLARSFDGGATFASRKDVHDPEAGPRFLLPSLVREPSGDLDLVYYAGKSEGDAQGSLRRATIPGCRPEVCSQAITPSEALSGPLVYTAARDSAMWLGDYIGVATHKGELFTSYVDNTSGRAHVGFARALPQRP